MKTIKIVFCAILLGLIVLAIFYSIIGIISIDTSFIVISIINSALYLDMKTTKNNN